MANNVSAKGLAILSGSPLSEKSVLGYGLAIKLTERGVKVLFIELHSGLEESCISGGYSHDLHNITTIDKGFVELASTCESGFDIIRCYLPDDSRLSQEVLKGLSDFISDSSKHYESIIISAPYGINPPALLVAGICEEIILTIDPQASSVASAYCLLKTLVAEGMSGRMATAFLNVDSPEHAYSLKKKFDSLTGDFLNLKLGDGGFTCFRQENSGEEIISGYDFKQAGGRVKNTRFESLRMFQTETKEESLAGVDPSHDEPGRYKIG